MAPVKTVFASALGLCAAVVLLGVVSAAATTRATQARPHILGLEYYEDLEGISGRRYNVGATIKGDTDKVKVALGELTATGHLSRRISPRGAGKSWYFRDRGFVRAVREDLNADGTATLTVHAAGSSVVKSCFLVLGFDPLYGDYGRGECTRIESKAPAS
jgi:hypothetical protein